MLRVLGCVYYQHDLRMLAAAACICIFACITARAMVLRGAASQDIKTRITWLLGAGMVSGAGAWSGSSSEKQPRQLASRSTVASGSRSVRDMAKA